MASNKEQFKELGEASKGFGAIHEEDRTPQAPLQIQSPFSEQRITSSAVVPTVAVPTSATVDPDADPLMVKLGAMTTAKLKTYVKDELATGEWVLTEEKRLADKRRQVTYKVVCALRELKSRCKATKTWEKTLRECGITPGTWRSWDCRELNQLTTGKRTKSRKPKPPVKTLAQAKADMAAARAAIDAQRTAAAAQSEAVEAEYVDDGLVNKNKLTKETLGDGFVSIPRGVNVLTEKDPGSANSVVPPNPTALEDWSIAPEDGPSASATDIYIDLMTLARIAETMAESVDLGCDLHQMFVGIQQRIGEVLDDIFDDDFDPAAIGWMGCSSELRKQRIQAIKNLMKKGSK